jgi:WD40 repeat protein
MLSAGNDGKVKMWNFNNGSMLREFMHSDPPKEITCVAYVNDEKRDQERVYAAGWNRKVYIWEDNDEVRSIDRHPRL